MRWVERTVSGDIKGRLPHRVVLIGICAAVAVLHSAAWATGPTLVARLLDVVPTTDGKPSPIRIVLGVDGVQNISIVAEVRRADGKVVQAHSTGFSLMPDAANATGQASHAGEIVEVFSPANNPLADGTYAERIQIDTEIAGYDYPVSQIDYRYFEVRVGNLIPLSSTEYSVLTEDVDTEGHPRMSAGPVVARADAAGTPILVRTGDTAVIGNTSERNER